MSLSGLKDIVKGELSAYLSHAIPKVGITHEVCMSRRSLLRLEWSSSRPTMIPTSSLGRALWAQSCCASSARLIWTACTPSLWRLEGAALSQALLHT